MVKKISPQAGLEPRTARSVGQRLTHRATGAPLNSGVVLLFSQVRVCSVDGIL